MSDKEFPDRIALDMSFQELLFLYQSIGIVCNGDPHGVIKTSDVSFHDWLHMSREEGRAFRERLSALFSHQASPIPISTALYLWVELIARSEQRQGAIVLHGHDFRNALCMPWLDIPSNLYTVQPHGRELIRDVNVSNVRRYGSGWEWETTTPEKFPEPPFLLTDDETCRLVFNGPVLVTSTEKEPYDPAWQLYGVLSEQLIGPSWFGGLIFEDDEAEKHDLVRVGHLTAYTRGEMGPFSLDGELTNSNDRVFKARLSLPPSTGGPLAE
ncbi:hypothetical protein V5E97_15015 [Singulisphaera sp. Ch08]|uniref:Uncharacterized protein n=1 Tax=Singulisphaera sp. Ch08 TaxID=3120278 RepID=A0AAU7CPC3_9BACT